MVVVVSVFWFRCFGFDVGFGVVSGIGLGINVFDMCTFAVIGVLDRNGCW